MQTRDDYVAKAKEELDALNAEIDELEARVDEAGDEAREAYQVQVAQLRGEYQNLKDKLADVRAAGEETGEDLREDVEDIYKALTQSINYFKSQV
jgi:archaellum component FlaC